jgi:hypothetical protein
MLLPHVLPVIVKAEAFAPVTDTLAIESEAVPLFVIKTLCVLTLRIL